MSNTDNIILILRFLFYLFLTFLVYAFDEYNWDNFILVNGYLFSIMTKCAYILKHLIFFVMMIELAIVVNRLIKKYIG